MSACERPVRRIELVDPVTSASVEFSSECVGARERVGERVLGRNVFRNPSFEDAGLPEVLARNLATNPSFEATDGEVVVRKNYVLEPWSSEALDGYRGGDYQTITVESGHTPPIEGLPDSAQKLVFDHEGPSGGGLKLTEGLPEGDYKVSLWAYRTSGPETTMQFAHHQVASIGGSRSFDSDTWTYAEETFSVSSGDAGKYLGFRSSVVDDSEDTTFYITNMQVAPVGEAVAEGDLVLSYEQDASSDFTYREGSGGISEEVADGVAGAEPYLATVWSSTDEPHHRSRFARYRLDSTSASALGAKDAYDSLQEGEQYTGFFMCRAVTRDQRVYPRVHKAQGSSAVLPKGEWTPVRTVVTAENGSMSQTGLLLQGNDGQEVGDLIDIDEHFVIEGDYDGPYFDGQSESEDDEDYDWEGDKDDSTSIRYLITLPNLQQTAHVDAIRSQQWAKRGDYSALVRNTDGEAGVAVVEVPDMSPGEQQTVQLSVNAEAHIVGDVDIVDGNNNVLGVLFEDGTVGEHTKLARFTVPEDAPSSTQYLRLRTGENEGDRVFYDSGSVVEGNWRRGYFDGDTPTNGDREYVWNNDGSSSAIRILYEPVPEWTYEDFTGWYDLTDDKVDILERPQGHGAFPFKHSWRSSLAVSFKAHVLAPSNSDAVREYERVTAFGHSRPVEMRYTDSVRTTSRMVDIRSIEAEQLRGFDTGTVSVDVVAFDERRYSVDDQWVTAEPRKPATGGLKWPVVWPATWDGEYGSDGRMTLTNHGTKSSAPVYRVYGGYESFELVNTGTQQRVGFDWTVPSGSYVELDFAKRTAMLNGTSDVSRYLKYREWWEVPAGASVTSMLTVDGANLGPYYAGLVRSAW